MLKTLTIMPMRIRFCESLLVLSTDVLRWVPASCSPPYPEIAHESQGGQRQ